MLNECISFVCQVLEKIHILNAFDWSILFVLCRKSERDGTLFDFKRNCRESILKVLNIIVEWLAELEWFIRRIHMQLFLSYCLNT